MGRSHMRRVLSAASTSILALVLAGIAPSAAQAAPTPAQPLTIPAVSHYTSDATSWSLNPSGKIILGGDAITTDGQTFAQEIGNILKKDAMSVTRDGAPAAGDIVIQTGDVAGVNGPEGYSIQVRDGALVITGKSAVGAWWGTRTVLQIIRGATAQPATFAGTITDEPAYGERLVMIDVGRKYFTPDFMKQQIRQMSYLKLNRLQLHLSEGIGYRLESQVAKEAVSPQHWTKAELAEILAVAKQYHVEVIPDVDTPGHMDNLLKAHPEWALTVNGKKSTGKLDLAVPEARQFAKDLLAEVIDMFPDSKVVHIGGDEYLPAPWEESAGNAINNQSAPSLVKYANEGVAGGNLGVNDAYAKYMNEIGDLVRSKGKVARMWNDDVYPKGTTIQVSRETELSQWIRWNASKPNTSDYVDAGFKVVNANGDYLYYILTNAGGSDDGLGTGPNKNPQAIYERWTPRTFMGAAGNGGDYILPDGKPMLGAHLSIWCDNADAQSEQKIAERFPEWMRAFSQSTWGSPKMRTSQADFERDVARRVGNAPLPQAGADSGADANTLPGPGLPAVYPGLREYQPVAGATPWTITDATRIIITSEELRADAKLVSREIAVIRGTNPPEIVVGTPQDAGEHDIVLNKQADNGIPNPEGYVLDTRAKGAVITGTTTDGVFYGTRTLLQSIQSSGGAQNALVRDWPEVKERSFHIDAARKYYSPDFFNQLIPQLAWRKVNTLQYHFSENEGFRLESTQHPEIVSAQHLTKDQLAEIIELATMYHIEVIPALDMPGHLRQVLSAHQDLRLSDSQEGRNGLNYAKPESRQLMKDLLAEYAPLFPSNKWHLGADEFIDFAAAQSKNTYPDLISYAKDVTGKQDATIADGFTYFINDMIDYLGTLGKSDVRVWNDGFYRSDINQTVQLSPKATVDYWTAWDRHMSPLETFVQKGHKVVNFNDKYMYYVLYYPGGAYHDRPQPKAIWNEYHPGVFPRHARGFAQTYERPYPQWLLGGSFAIWSDNERMETEEQVLANSTPLVDAFAGRAWAPEDKRDHSTYTSNIRSSGRAPILPKEVKVKLESALQADPAAGAVAAKSPISYTATTTNKTTVPVETTVSINTQATAGQLMADGVTAQILDENGKPVMNQARNVAAASEGSSVTASGTEEISPGVPSSFTPDKATDGDTTGGSRWSSLYDDNSWIQVTFAQPQTLDKVRLAWQEACAPTYEVMVKLNDGQWKSLGKNTITCPSGKSEVLWTEHPVSADVTGGQTVTAVKMQASSRVAIGGTKYGVSLWEIQALTPATPVQVPAPTVENGVITWKGTLAPRQHVALKWAGVAPAAPARGQNPASATVTLNASGTAMGFAGTAAEQSVTHTVAPAKFSVTPHGTDTLKVNQNQEFQVDVHNAVPDTDAVFQLHSDVTDLGTVRIASAEETVTLRVPCSVEAGEHRLVVTNGDATAELPVTVAADPAACGVYHPTVTVPAEPVAPGSKVAITAAGFAPQEAVALEIVRITDPATGAGDVVAGPLTITADASGAFATTMDLVKDLPAGSYTVRATGSVSKTPAVATLTVVALSPTPSPEPTNPSVPGKPDVPAKPGVPVKPGMPSKQGLSHTGMQAGGIMLLAGMSVLCGAVLLGVRRVRRES
ncbi:family 20 glycosylhydrolase [Trueperella sp. LYQ143]|uniref:family 20 glycosylhydrolase n=1 Tax=Trueperella sp. LYQ143 TaxID=3391059 RepID=UPI003982EFC3